jgi:hypothetical protein
MVASIFWVSRRKQRSAAAVQDAGWGTQLLRAALDALATYLNIRDGGKAMIRASTKAGSIARQESEVIHRTSYMVRR